MTNWVISFHRQTERPGGLDKVPAKSGANELN